MYIFNLYINISILKKAIICLMMLAMLGCNNRNTIKVVVEDLEQACDISCFRGIKADICYNELIATVGEPNEILKSNNSDEDAYYNPVYYYQEGKIVCYWTGWKKDPIGLIEYTPYLNMPMHIDEFLKFSNCYGIKSETKEVAIFNGTTLYYVVFLDNFQIKKIEYWAAKKKLFNVADMYD